MMRRLLLVGLLVCWASPASAAIARVGSAQGQTLTAATTASATITLTTGNAVVIFVSWSYQQGRTITSVVDANNTYTAAGSLFCDAASGCGQFYYSCSVTGGTNLQPTVTISAGVGGLSIQVHEYSGMATSSCFDQAVTNSGATGSNSQSVASTTPTNDNALVISGHIAAVAAWTGITAGSGYTLDLGQGLSGGDVDAYMQTQYVVQGTKTATTAPMTASSGSGVGWLEVAAMFNAATGGSAPPPSNFLLLGVGQ